MLELCGEMMALLRKGYWRQRLDVIFSMSAYLLLGHFYLSHPQLDHRLIIYAASVAHK